MQKETRLSNILLAATSAVGLALLAFPAQRTVSAIRALLSYSLHPVPLAVQRSLEEAGDAPSNLLDLMTADQENRRLRQSMKSLSFLSSRLRELRAENARLRHLLELKPPKGYEGVWAALLFREPGRWYSYVVLDKGSSDGIELNSPVLAEQDGAMGLVGRIAEVSPDTSKVQLVTDDLSSVAVTVGDGWAGLADGLGAPFLQLNFVSDKASLSKGQEVRISEISSTFPPGVAVGRISAVYESDPNLSFLSARVEPQVQLGTLREVMVLTKPSGAVEEAD